MSHFMLININKSTHFYELPGENQMDRRLAGLAIHSTTKLKDRCGFTSEAYFLFLYYCMETMQFYMTIKKLQSIWKTTRKEHYKDQWRDFAAYLQWFGQNWPRKAKGGLSVSLSAIFRLWHRFQCVKNVTLTQDFWLATPLLHSESPAN